MKLSRWLLLGAVAALPALPAPAHAADQPLRVALEFDPAPLDPATDGSYTNRVVTTIMCDSLIDVTPDLKFVPELATSWEWAADRMSLTLHLRQGVVFQDGTPFDAAVVKWNIDKRLDPATASPQRELLAPVIAAVEATGKLTVVFNLKEPYPGLFSLLGERAGFMVSPTAYEKLGKDFANAPVGTGAFLWKSWVRGSALTLERNPAYWEAGLPYLDSVVFRDLAGAVVGTQRLLTGELDVVMELSPQDIRVIDGKPGIALKPITLGRWYFLQWHVNTPPFDNAKLRQAFAHAIDRQRLNDIVMRGKGTVSDGPTPEGLWWNDPSIKAPAHDPARARALLTEAGYPNGFSFVLSTPQVAAFQQLNQLLQEQLAEAGIKVTLQTVGASEWYGRVVDGTTNLTPTRWVQRPDPDGLMYILFHSKGFANTTKYQNPEVDRLLDTARATYDVDLRKRLYSDAQRLIVADLPVAPLIFGAEYAAMVDKVRDFVWIPDQIPRFRSVWKAA